MICQGGGGGGGGEVVPWHPPGWLPLPQGFPGWGWHPLRVGMGVPLRVQVPWPGQRTPELQGPIPAGARSETQNQSMLKKGLIVSLEG